MIFKYLEVDYQLILYKSLRIHIQESPLLLCLKEVVHFNLGLYQLTQFKGNCRKARSCLTKKLDVGQCPFKILNCDNLIIYQWKNQMSMHYNLYYSIPPFFFNLAPVQPQIPYQSQIYNPVILNQFPVNQAPPTTTSWAPSNNDLGTLRQPSAENDLRNKKKIWRIPQMRQQARKRDEVFCQRNQNKDRNLISYILKGFIHLVFQSREIAELAKLASQRLSLPNGVSSFFQFIQDRFPSKKTYVGLRYMKNLIEKAKEDPMSRILAITLNYYLKISYKLIVLQKPHTSKKNKLKLLKKTKELWSLLFEK